MPTYVYGCRACGKEFEIEQRITEASLTDCESCGAEGGLRRLIQPVAVSFKGAGFHINDYSSKPAPAESSEATSASTGSVETNPSESSPTETKPEAKPADSPASKATDPAKE